MNSRLFAIGDIHGCFDSLKELVENKIQLQKDDKLILLGDYIDRGDKSKEVVDCIIEFFKGLRYYYSFENFLFVHAGFNENGLNPFNDYYTMLWYCKENYSNLFLSDKTIVHGHNPVRVAICEERVLAKHRVINIDTGCVYKDSVGYGRLAAFDCNCQRILLA